MKGMARIFAVFVITISLAENVLAQCGSAAGNQTSYGAGSWIGYVYDGVNSFTTGTYNGTITETEFFNETFCGDNCNFFAASGCSVNSETFTVRFKMRKNFTCGTYQFTIGGDDGVRLSVDGGATYLIDYYTDHSYGTATATAFMTAGNHDLILEYYENTGQNRVSYTATNLGIAGTGGTIGSSQTFCQSGNIDPAAFTSIAPAAFCAAGSPAYQWQSSTDNVTFGNIGSATGLTYDVPSSPIVGTVYYRRRAINGAVTVYSNVITVIQDAPIGNPATYPAAGAGWIGYVYDGVNNFSNYQGNFTIGTTVFDQSFCGDNCTFPINGCDINTETFTVRFRLTLNVTTAAGYAFTIGGDDGVRLSVDGVTVINDYADHGYQTATSSTINLAVGNHLLVLDYYENGGGNRVTFDYATGPLPVTWSFLDGYCEGETSVVEWRTASELNNERFVVQRSTDGVKFDSVGSVAGSGTSSIEHAYTFRDSSPVYGWNYYRLKQIDLDGKFEYSRLVPVQVNNLPSTFIYPNPISGELFISRLNPQESVSVTLKNVTTNRSYKLVQDTQQPSRFVLDKVEPGIYVATFTMGMKVISEKVVVY